MPGARGARGLRVQVPMSDLFGAGGQQLLARVELPPAFRARVGSATRVLECVDFEIEVFTKLLTGRLRGHRGYTAIQAIPGVGAILGAVFVAEIGEVGRFRRAAQLASWAGLSPKHHESDTKVRRGGSPSRATGWSAEPRWKQSSESAPTTGLGSCVTAWVTAKAAHRHRRRRPRTGRTGLYGLRDGHIRCLHHTSA